MNETKYIAIADDHTMVRKGLCALINLFPGYEVILETGNGRELSEQIGANRLPHIVLLDIAMPEMDGYQTAAWLRTHYPEIKVLALSTMESESAILRMIRAGVRGYLHKDAEPAELKRAFEDVLSIGYFYNEYVNRAVMRSANQDEGTDDPAAGLPKLTDRELAFLRLACTEKTYYEISKEMFVSERTVDGYRDSLFKKLHVTTRVGLALYAIRNGLVQV